MARRTASKTLALTLSLALACAASVGTAADPTGDPAFLPAGAKLETLVDGKTHDLFFAEGPVVTCDGMVLWSDITLTAFKKGPRGWDFPAGHIMKYNPQTREVSVFRSPSGQSNGLRMDRDCNLLAAEGADFGGRRVTRTDMKTGRTTVVTGQYNGRAYNGPNDITIDSKGRIYFSDPRYMGHEAIEQSLMAVYRVDPDGKVTQIITDAGKPNGVATCPGDRHLFVVGHDNGVLDLLRNPASPTAKGVMALLQYDLDASGNVSNRKVLVDYLPEDGPDSMACDAEGNLWVAVRDAKRPGIYAYSVQNGKAVEKAYIPTPQTPTNAHFGRGKDINYLYITAGNSLYGIRTGKKGYHLQ